MNAEQTEKQSKRYNVVFEYAPGNLSAGGRFWTSYPRAREFKRLYTEQNKKDLLVVAQGISDKEAITISGQASLQGKINSCRAEATDPKTGQFNVGVFAMHLNTMIAVELIDRNSL